MDTGEDIARDEFISDLYTDFANDLLAGKDGELIRKTAAVFIICFLL
jgi:hypothetical protein